MSTLIIYASTHGSTEKCVEQLKKSLDDDDILAVNIKTRARPALCSFDTVIVGGSIHAGKIQRKIRTFCRNNEEILKKKNLGLFLCCLEEAETAQKQFENAFPHSLRERATASGLFGGALEFKRLNFIFKSIIRSTGITESMSKINTTAINRFAKTFNQL